MRKNIMLGTAGHVDHGKTALVKVLTGCDTDTLAEEKARGLTIDLGFAPCRLAGGRIVGIVDVPGHVDFIRNMVAGAHGIDVVIFVVAADDGVMPQTHEHLHILTLMGLRHGLVALTKVDLVDSARLAAVMENLRGLLAGTFLAEAPICPISNVSGQGFEGFFDELNRIVDQCEARPSTGPFRVWVEDVFSIRGSGTIITGIPTSGRVRVGDRLELVPGGLTGHLRRMQVYGEEAVEARAGECVALNLPEMGYESIHRGQTLCDPDSLAPVSMVEAELRTLGSLRDKIEDYIEVHLHVGTASVQARVAMLEKLEMRAGERQMVQLRLDEALALAPGDRYVIRSSGGGAGSGGLATIGGGLILGVSNVRLRRQRPWTLANLAARYEAIDDPDRWCEQMLKEEHSPVTSEELRRKSRLRPQEIGATVGRLQAAGRIWTTPGGALVHRAVLEEAADRLLMALESFHAQHDQRAGARKEEWFAGAGADTALLEAAAGWLEQTNRITLLGTVHALAGWKPKVADRDQQLLEQVCQRYQQAGWTPPSLDELSAQLKEPQAKLERAARLLAERGLLVRLDERVVMHQDAIEAAKQEALKLFQVRPIFTTMQFRDALAVSRKYAVPLLDHLDRVRFTVRSGHDRTPGVEARKRMK